MEPWNLVAARLTARAELGMAVEKYRKADTDAEKTNAEHHIKDVLQDAASIAEPPLPEAPSSTESSSSQTRSPEGITGERGDEGAQETSLGRAPLTTGQLRTELAMVEDGLHQEIGHLQGQLDGHRTEIRTERENALQAIRLAQAQLGSNMRSCLEDLSVAQRRVSNARSDLRKRLGTSGVSVNVSEVFEALRLELRYNEYPICGLDPPKPLRQSIDKVKQVLDEIGEDYRVVVKAFFDGDPVDTNDNGRPLKQACQDANVTNTDDLVTKRGKQIAEIFGDRGRAEPVMDEFLCDPGLAGSSWQARSACFRQNRRVELVIETESGTLRTPDSCHFMAAATR
jgi:hypothetical protein